MPPWDSGCVRQVRSEEPVVGNSAVLDLVPSIISPVSSARCPSAGPVEFELSIVPEDAIEREFEETKAGNEEIVLAEDSGDVR